MTMKLPSENAENYEIRELSKGDGYVISQTHSDGSETTFFIKDDYEIEVVRVGKDTKVMLKRIHKDDSETTFTVATEFYEEHAEELSEFIDDPERDTNDDQERVPEGFELVDDRPPICPNGCGLLAPVGHGDMECSACDYRRTVIDHKEN